MIPEKERNFINTGFKGFITIIRAIVLSYMAHSIVTFGLIYITGLEPYTYASHDLNNLDVPDSNSRVLIIAPHNDDETLGTAGLIDSTLRNGGKVKVVLVTNGDAHVNAMRFYYFKFSPGYEDYIALGYDRQKETLDVMRRYGLSESDIIFLGYPDNGISNMLYINWEDDKPYTSPYTNSSVSPYSNSYSRLSKYSGINLSRDLSQIISGFNPTHIAYPHPDDDHGDHKSTNAFVRYVLAGQSLDNVKELLYLVHKGYWPIEIIDKNDGKIVPPIEVITKESRWSTLDLDDYSFKSKISAIDSYRTQTRTAKIFLDAFKKRNELFCEYR